MYSSLRPILHTALSLPRPAEPSPQCRPGLVSWRLANGAELFVSRIIKAKHFWCIIHILEQCIVYRKTASSGIKLILRPWATFVPISAFFTKPICGFCGSAWRRMCSFGVFGQFFAAFLQILPQLQNFFLKSNSCHHPRTRRHPCALGFLSPEISFGEKQSPNYPPTQLISRSMNLSAPH